MRNFRIGVWFGLLAMLVCLPAWAQTPQQNDIRVLIDISGSMKKNDPENLRRPALRMLVGLMQPGTRAGAWTFAKWSNPLVPMSDVDDAWKKSALAKSNQITSPGLFTHVERVLEDAIKDWEGKPTKYNRHLVLLTDGMVDVSKKPEESAVSRQRIIDELLPRLKEKGVQVHTIALSERADHELMKQLSTGTNGWYQQVETADTLQRVFLKIFEQVGKPDSVPLNDNKFTVDSSVKEASVLLFRTPGSPDPVLVSPSGEQFTDTDLPAGVAWYRDQGYDLITISSPGKGEWSLRADIDPDNRVMIVTDLKLVTSKMPTHIAVGETIPVTANLTAKGKVVQRKAFLRLLDVRADALTEAGGDPQGLNDAGQEGDSKAGDGIYSMNYQENRAFEQVQLLFSVESPTFMREKRYRMAVHELVSLEVSDDGRAVALLNSAVMRDDAKVEVWQEDEDKKKLPLSPAGDGRGYELEEEELPVYVRVEGISKLGNLVSRTYGPEYAPGKKPAPAPAEPEPVAAEPEPEPAAPEKEEEPPAEEEVAEEEDDWVMPAIIFGSANLALLLIGGGVWWFLRKRRGKDEESLMDEFEESSDDSLGADISEETTEVTAESGTEGESDNATEASADKSGDGA